MYDIDDILVEIKETNELLIALRREYGDLFDWYIEGGYTFAPYKNTDQLELDLPDDLKEIQRKINLAQERKYQLSAYWRDALLERRKTHT